MGMSDRMNSWQCRVSCVTGIFHGPYLHFPVHSCMIKLSVKKKTNKTPKEKKQNTLDIITKLDSINGKLLSEFSQQVHFIWILPRFQILDVPYILAEYPVILTQGKQSSSFCSY